MDHMTPQQRSYCMSRIRATDTKPELMVRSALHKKGYRFRKNVKTLQGKPDIVFPKAKLVIFIDGDFWHGYKYETWTKPLKPYWKKKIESNIQRDQQNRAVLRKAGWTVLSFWEHEIYESLSSCIEKIERQIFFLVSNADEKRSAIKSNNLFTIHIP